MYVFGKFATTEVQVGSVVEGGRKANKKPRIYG